MTWVVGRVWAVVTLALLATVVVGAVHFDWIVGDTAFILMLGAIGIFIIGTVWSFVSYLSYRQQWAGLRPGLVVLPNAMVGFYSEIHSDGALSVKRMRQEAQRLSDMGAVWPGGVWALLDDMEARSVIVMT